MGVILYYQQLSTSGPMGRNVEDTIRLLGTMAGYDSRAPLGLRDEIPAYDAFRKTDFAGFRVGWIGDYEGYLTTEPGLLDLCERSLEGISTHGVMVENCMPAYDMARLWQTWLALRHWSQGGMKALYDDPATKTSFNLTVPLRSLQGRVRHQDIDHRCFGLDDASHPPLSADHDVLVGGVIVSAMPQAAPRRGEAELSGEKMLVV